VSILLVDIGNSRIKWARFDGRRLGRQRAASFTGWRPGDFAREVFSSRRDIERILVSSVAGTRVNNAFTVAARRAGVVAPEFVATSRRAGGVTTAYLEPWRLGVDRFVAAIGGFHEVRRRAVCIVSVGTALTIDLVDGKGRHRGGSIIPAPGLMVESLLSQTSGIRRRANGGGAGGAGFFARSTRAAIEQGARYAAAAAIDRATEEARRLVGRTPVVLLTGGGAKAVGPLVKSAFVSVPDLVLKGLAILAQQGKHLSVKS
jgi:type III pantothenate kinase